MLYYFCMNFPTARELKNWIFSYHRNRRMFARTAHKQTMDDGQQFCSSSKQLNNVFPHKKNFHQFNYTFAFASFFVLAKRVSAHNSRYLEWYIMIRDTPIVFSLWNKKCYYINLHGSSITFFSEKVPCTQPAASKWLDLQNLEYIPVLNFELQI